MYRRRTIAQETVSLYSARRGTSGAANGVSNRSNNKKGKINARRALLFIVGCLLLCLVEYMYIVIKLKGELSESLLIEKKEGMSNSGPLNNAYETNVRSKAMKQPLLLQEKEHKGQEAALYVSTPQGKRSKTLAGNCPLPTDIFLPNGGQVLIKPNFGTHRSGVDAVFAFAQGYSLKSFIGFVESLHRTGFDGDIVLSISSPSTLKDGVEEYLRTNTNVIAYSVDWKCYRKSGDPIAEPDAESDCNIVGFYGNMDGQFVDDPRLKRPLATARFELFWAWSLNYSPKSMLMLIDFRDSYFQLHPFTEIERSSSTSAGGILHVFEENSIVPLGQSEYNAQWIRQAYGKEALEAFTNKTIICSGSTMGEQVAIEQYLHCMIQQFDVTKCKRKGCDQGFHNYILHQKLMNDVDEIEKIVSVKQGSGAINNLGILRSKPLSEQGVYDKEKQLVLNWDGSVSPVVHQYDRDGELNNMMNNRLSTMMQDWMQANTMKNQLLAMM